VAFGRGAGGGGRGGGDPHTWTLFTSCRGRWAVGVPAEWVADTS